MKRILAASAGCLVALSVIAFAQPPKTASSPLAGTWNCIAKGLENKNVPFTLYLQQSGDQLTGSVSSPKGDADLTSVSAKGGELKIEIDSDDGNYVLNGTLNNGKLSGQWKHGENSGSWEGTKQNSGSGSSK